MGNQGFPAETVEAIRDSVDCNLYFFGSRVALGSMYLILIVSITIAVALYIIMNRLRGKKQN